MATIKELFEPRDWDLRDCAPADITVAMIVDAVKGCADGVDDDVTQVHVVTADGTSLTVLGVRGRPDGAVDIVVDITR